MTQKIEKEMLKNIPLISGFAGFANVDLSKSGNKLPTLKNHLGFSFNETDDGIFVEIGICVDKNVRAKTIVYEIHSIVKNILKNHEKKIDNIIIHIRDVK